MTARRLAPLVGPAVMVACFGWGCAADHQVPGTGAPQPWLLPPTYVGEVGHAGLAERSLRGISAGAPDEIWLAEAYPPRLTRFDDMGRVLGRIDLAATLPDQPRVRPDRLALAPDGTIWLTDVGYGVLRHLDAAGTSLGRYADENSSDRPAWDLVDLVVGADGAAYALDRDAREVLVYGADVGRRGVIGRRCGGDCGFEDPVGICVAPDGDLLVLDADDDRVKRYHPDGSFVASWSVGTPDAERHFSARGLTTGPDGFVHLVVDGATGQRIWRFTPDGVMVDSRTVLYGCDENSVPAIRTPLVVGPGGDYFALDACGAQIRRMSRDGRGITAFNGGDPGAFSIGSVEQVVVDARGHLFTVSQSGGVFELDAEGRMIHAFEAVQPRARRRDVSVGRIAVDGRGRLYRALRYDPVILRTPLAGGPTDTLNVRLPEDRTNWSVDAFAVDDDGWMFVALQNRQIRVFDEEARLRGIRLLMPPAGTGAVPTTYGAVADLRVTAEGELWALDSTYRRIVRWDAGGARRDEIRFAAEGIEGIRYPLSMAPAPGGFIDILNELNGKIYRFDGAGHYLFRWGGLGAGAGQNCHPIGITWDASGSLYVADQWCRRINVYRY